MSEPLNRVSHVCLVAGGVLTWRLPDLTLAVLGEAKSPPADVQLGLDDLENSLALGRITPGEYCRRAGALVHSPLAPELIEAAVMARAAVLPQMGDLIGELAERNRVTLVSDYPQMWLESILRTHPSGGRLSTVNYLSEVGAPDLGASSIQGLIRRGWLVPGESCWIDWNPVRVSTAIRCDLAAQIFVDSFRLRRELEMVELVAPKGIGAGAEQ